MGRTGGTFLIGLLAGSLLSFLALVLLQVFAPEVLRSYAQEPEHKDRVLLALLGVGAIAGAVIALVREGRRAARAKADEEPPPLMPIFLLWVLAWTLVVIGIALFITNCVPQVAFEGV